MVVNSWIHIQEMGSSITLLDYSLTAIANRDYYEPKSSDFLKIGITLKLSNQDIWYTKSISYICCIYTHSHYLLLILLIGKFTENIRHIFNVPIFGYTQYTNDRKEYLNVQKVLSIQRTVK